jgi:hypothetical protein
MITKKWNEAAFGPLCLEAVKAQHQPPKKFRISPSRYSPGTQFPGTSRAHHLYIICGACELTMGDIKRELRVSDVVELPEGDYYLRVLGDSPCESISVWELPPAFWAPDDT